MNILGIDWGKRKIGLAIADGILAEPYGIINNNNWEMVISVAIALLIVNLLDKYALSKLPSYDEFGSYDGEEYA